MYEQIKYSKYLSNLFSAITIAGLSVLCLLNNLTLDLYSALFLIKIVIPAALCNWFIGYVVGKILDANQAKRIYKKIANEKKAYEIPSIFSADTGSENASLFEQDNGLFESENENNANGEI